MGSVFLENREEHLGAAPREKCFGACALCGKVLMLGGGDKTWGAWHVGGVFTDPAYGRGGANVCLREMLKGSLSHGFFTWFFMWDERAP
ncbi:hypothetical protein GCM10023261_14650 [Bartonella jaculi]|uniref:Uncharacterized protein n=1 Tax=Bartonella jaculi TaxID=686226 RepID=A0ABP9N8P9_9HYPH